MDTRLLFLVVTILVLSHCAKPPSCKGKNGEKYKIGKGYIDGCRKYTCQKAGKRGKMVESDAGICCYEEGKVYTEGQGYSNQCHKFICQKVGGSMDMVSSDSGSCCFYNGQFHPLGKQIKITKVGKCTTLITTCKLRNGRPEVITEIDAHCCLFNGSVVSIGALVAQPKACQWLRCQQGPGHNETYSDLNLNVEVEYDSTGCCLGSNGSMFQDGSVTTENNQRAKCCQGKWMSFMTSE